MKSSKDENIYIQSILTSKIYLHVTEIGKELEKNLERKLIDKISNRCIQEGYVSPNDITIISRSSGIVNINSVMYHVVYECNIAHPVEGMLITSKVKTITKAGIHAEVVDDNGNIPVTIFVARDHNFKFNAFDVSEGESIITRVIGIRYELNDPYVSVIANIETKKINNKNAKNDNNMNKLGGSNCNEKDKLNEANSGLLELL